MVSDHFTVGPDRFHNSARAARDVPCPAVGERPAGTPLARAEHLTLFAALICWAVLVSIWGMRKAAATEPAASSTRGVTLYVSKLGDNTDGRTWSTAFRTIQAALNAIPDANGGHRVIIRPDAYDEANLYPAYSGAEGAYNVIEGDWDGQLGSGTNGWVVIDSGAPRVVVRTNPTASTGNPTWMIVEGGDPDQEAGLKSVDWWGPWRCDPAYSAVIWDRWIYRRLYSTGSEGGMGWDLSSAKGARFSAVVEDCVGIGRFAGACAIAHSPRPDEPVVFRRSYFLNLDWWGDAGGVYVRGESPSMPDAPHAVFEDCTIVGPDNALQAGYPGVDDLFTRVRFTRCRLIVLNFSQPHGTPSSGIVCCGCKDGRQLRVEFEDCDLMGFKVFGTRQGDVSYSTKGRCTAYVQYRSPVPDGFERLRFWPVEVFKDLMPPRFHGPSDSDVSRPRLVKLPFAMADAMESTPVVYQGRPLLVYNRRDDTKNKTDDYTRSMHLFVSDLVTGRDIARFGEGHSFANAFVRGDELNVFASEGTNRDWFQSLYRFQSTDLTNWSRALAIPQAEGEHLFNASVCQDDQGYVMAYESDKPVMVCVKFARSADLAQWSKVDGLIFTGANREYSACPVLRYHAPYYYVIYLHAAIPGHTGWVSFLARSRDLESWDLSPFNPILEAGPGEGINNSDVDIFEWEGRTYLYYATGDQSTWGAVRTAQYSGPMRELFERSFPPGLPTLRVTTRH